MEPTAEEKARRERFLNQKQRQFKGGPSCDVAGNMRRMNKVVAVGGAVTGLMIAGWLTFFGVQDTFQNTASNNSRLKGVQFGSRGRSSET